MSKGADLLICDTYGHLSGQFEKVKFKGQFDRDEYIRDVGDVLNKNKVELKKGKEKGNIIFGSDVFSFTSLGEKIFGKKYTKRLLVWNKDTDYEKGYTNNLAFFGWAVLGSGWIFNLEKGSKFFRGEYLETDIQYKEPLDVARSIVRTFSNEGGKVINIELFDNSIIKKAIELEKREYVGIGVDEKHGIK